MDDGAGNAGELPVEIGNDAIHPALLARVLRLGGETGPVLNPIEADQRRKVGTIRIQSGIDLIVGDETIRCDPVFRILAQNSGGLAKT
jgi:hypothetical protein